jgi:hypothetical protein
MEVSAVYLINLAVCQNKLSLINIFKNKNLWFQWRAVKCLNHYNSYSLNKNHFGHLPCLSS